MSLSYEALARKARALYAASHQGVLSTISQEVAGYPFGSVVAFAPDPLGCPVILISTIAEHTQNIGADHRVSLTLMEGGDDAQAAGRLTLVGDTLALYGKEETLAAGRYFARFPHAAEYRRVHDFSFYRIVPRRIRYIGGFGQIRWIAVEDMCHLNPFDDQAESAMVTHMNTYHVDAMQDYCRLFGIDPQGHEPRLAGVDTEGFDLMLGKRLARIPFDEPVHTGDEVRKAMITLVRRARQAETRAA